VQNHLETFLALCGEDWEEERVSPHAERELRRYLECGILAYGFARARCDDCGHDFLIAFSCKGRGVCPSCNTRRMAETAAHLADHVLPRMPVRQWVLALPKRLRYHLRHDREALSSALRLFLDAVERRLRSRCPGAGVRSRTGAVAFIHRFGSSLNQHTHCHVVFIDGVFAPDPEQGAHCIEAEEPYDAEAVRTQRRRRILRAFVRRGLLEKEERKEMEQWDHGGGFSLDASVRIEAHDRQGLERLPRDGARPPFAADRLEEIDAERLIDPRPKPGPEGQTQLILSPLEPIGRIAALVPPPRPPRHRYYGVLAPHSPRRPAVTALAPAPGATAPESVAKPAVEAVADDPPPHRARAPARYPWAMLLARIDQAFPWTCPRCGAEMRIIAVITEAVEVRAILEHLGEPATPPRIASARGPPKGYED